MIEIKNGNMQNTPCYIGHIDAIAYDGYEFSLLSSNQRAIVKLDQQLCPVKTIPTCRKYHCLCYCEQQHCYWAMTSQRPCTVFMLDENFTEINSIKLTFTNLKEPCAISCSPCEDSLIILYTDTIVQVDVSNHEYRCTPIEQTDMHVCDILSLLQGYVIAYLQDQHFVIEVNCHKFAHPTHFCIPENYQYEGMYLCNYTRSSSTHIVYEVHLLLSSTVNFEECILPLQITCCSESCTCKEELPSYSCGINDILHSIALEEAGLAHILNAEGEKIQKAVASNASIEELLQVNASVRNTINKVTLLEGQLIAKLESILCFCEENEHGEYPCEDECDPCFEE